VANYFRTRNDQGQTVRTDKAATESVADHLERHINDVLAQIEDGWIVGNEICTRWEVTSTGGTYDSCTSRNQGPPPETDDEYLDRHFEQVANDVGSHPPS
jgi:hypothetical protein